MVPVSAAFLDHVARRLAGSLPGRSAQAAMAPELAYGRHAGPPAWNARPAAVLLLLYPRQDRWYLPLTRRPDSLAAHGGQISLPGGGLDAQEGPEQAACRELYEELGVTRDALRLLGRLSPIYVYNSNFLVTPCVAATLQTPLFVPNPHEVADLLQVPLDQLTQPERVQSHVLHRWGTTFRAPHYQLGEDQVWGATSMILAEFLQVVEP